MSSRSVRLAGSAEVSATGRKAHLVDAAPPLEPLHQVQLLRLQPRHLAGHPTPSPLLPSLLLAMPRRRMKRWRQQQQPREPAQMAGEKQQRSHPQRERRRERLEAHALRQSELPAHCCCLGCLRLPRPVQLKAPSV